MGWGDLILLNERPLHVSPSGDKGKKVYRYIHWQMTNWNKDECVGKTSFDQTCLLLGANDQASNMAHELFWKGGRGNEIPSVIEDFFSKE